MSAVQKDIYPEAASSSSSSGDDLADKPIKFSTSEANKRRSYDTFVNESNAPWYQIHCIMGSLAVFLIYFCVLREENDVDEQMGQSIWERIPSLQEQNLMHKIREGEVAGTDVGKLKNELEELQKKFKK